MTDETTEALLREAIEAYRATRDPRWARVASAASERALPEPRPVVGAGRKKGDDEAWDALEKARDPLDLPRLVAALRGASAGEAARRVRVLARRDDPRLVEGLLAILEAPPWRANVYKEFVKAALDALVATRDVRARDALLDLSRRYKAIVETSVGDWVGTQLARSAAAMAEVAPRPSTPALAGRLDECERAMGPPPQKRAARSDDELLALVYAAPDDDGPRLVFADALLERGDERGEFIQLQVARAAGRGSREGLLRERALARDPKRLAAWGLPLVSGGEVRLRRGFPATLVAKPAVAKKVLGAAALATLEELDGLQQLSAKVALELLDEPRLGPVRTVGALPQLVLDRLAPGPRPWTALVVHGVPSNALLRSLGALRALTLRTVEATMALPDDLFEGTHLETLHLDTGWTGALPPALLAPLPGLRRLGLGYLGTAKEPRAPVSFLAAQRALEWLSLPDADPLYLALAETVRVQSLCLPNYHLTAAQLEAFLATQPSLRTLELTSPTLRWATVPVVAELLARHPTLARIDCPGAGWALDREGTLELQSLLSLTLDEAAAHPSVRRVRVVERVFAGDALRWTSLADDAATLDKVRRWADARGVPLETPDGRDRAKA